MKYDILTVGFPMVEIMRKERNVPFDVPADFTGPYPSADTCIMLDVAARLGRSCCMLGVTGNDTFADVVTKRLSSDGVDISHMTRLAGRGTIVVFVRYEADGTREYLECQNNSAATAFCAEDFSYRCKMKWSYSDYERVLREYHEIVAMLNALRAKEDRLGSPLAEQLDVLPLIYTGLSSGLRQCELITLSWADFHVRYRYILKGQRLLTLNAKAERLLKQIPETDSPYVFRNPKTGAEYKLHEFYYLHKKILKQARLPWVAFGDLQRQCMVSHCVAANRFFHFITYQICILDPSCRYVLLKNSLIEFHIQPAFPSAALNGHKSSTINRTLY